MKHFKDHNPIVLLFLNLTIGNTISKDDFFCCGTYFPCERLGFIKENIGVTACMFVFGIC